MWVVLWTGTGVDRNADGYLPTGGLRSSSSKHGKHDCEDRSWARFLQLFLTVVPAL